MGHFGNNKKIAQQSFPPKGLNPPPSPKTKANVIFYHIDKEPILQFCQVWVWWFLVQLWMTRKGVKTRPFQGAQINYPWAGHHDRTSAQLSSACDSVQKHLSGTHYGPDTARQWGFRNEWDVVPSLKKLTGFQGGKINLCDHLFQTPNGMQDLDLSEPWNVMEKPKRYDISNTMQWTLAH